MGGCSILYHLARQGWKDVVLVEQYGLTHGSTWHSAGLVGQLRSTVSLTKMMQYSVGLYADLARETGKDPGVVWVTKQKNWPAVQRKAESLGYRATARGASFHGRVIFTVAPKS